MDIQSKHHAAYLVQHRQRTEHLIASVDRQVSGTAGPQNTGGGAPGRNRGGAKPEAEKWMLLESPRLEHGAHR